MAGRVILFGATGYTGRLAAEAMTRAGLAPVLAGRSREALVDLVADLAAYAPIDAAPTWQQGDVADPASVRALVRTPDDVLVSTVGPFARLGRPAVDAAIDAGCAYVDSTGEPGFIRRLFEVDDADAQHTKARLLPAFGYDYVPGNLAGALAMREAQGAAVRVEIGYFVRGRHVDEQRHEGQCRGHSGRTALRLAGRASDRCRGRCGQLRRCRRAPRCHAGRRIRALRAAPAGPSAARRRRLPRLGWTLDATGPRGRPGSQPRCPPASRRRAHGSRAALGHTADHRRGTDPRSARWRSVDCGRPRARRGGPRTEQRARGGAEPIRPDGRPAGLGGGDAAHQAGDGAGDPRPGGRIRPRRPRPRAAPCWDLRVPADLRVVERLDEATWRERQRRHVERVEPWVRPRRERRLRGATHPVDDFLFDYYPYSVAKLTAWHPGAGVLLQGDCGAFLASPAYVEVEGGVMVDLRRLADAVPRLRLAVRLLAATAERTPQLGCFGLHEWAMVYGQTADEVRHASYPLRLDPAEVRSAVDEVGLRCTHIDAYRFFTQAATPLNAHVPTRAEQHTWEQPGCLHANMDLYKYAMWFSPFVTSELVADCFELARCARELDMRAAPYDLSDLGYQPIRVEEAAGRAEYVALQRDIADDAAPLRARLVDVLTSLEGSIGD